MNSKSKIFEVICHLLSYLSYKANRYEGLLQQSKTSLGRPNPFYTFLRSYHEIPRYQPFYGCRFFCFPLFLVDFFVIPLVWICMCTVAANLRNKWVKVSRKVLSRPKVNIEMGMGMDRMDSGQSLRFRPK